MVILNQCLLWLGQEDFRFLVTDIGYPRKLYHHFFSGRRSKKHIFRELKIANLGVVMRDMDQWIVESVDSTAVEKR